MNFVLTEQQLYWWPVTVRIPDPDTPGKIVEQQFKIQFEAQDQDEAVAHTDGYQGLTTAEAQAAHERAWLRRISRNWDDVVGPDKAPIPFNDATFGNALQQTWFRIGVYDAYRQSINGQEVRLGN
ncbi:hypothetical protein [Puniceibacterium sp. IMCC21224]|uniref:hypothetical protein n=1 Tax=Puniceibacterium sp. IMCC21224 TaxID=1618204 RepID=UPI00064E1487|nr:hypothetical protein [Puniceibacterium sp. IMCC21224]KMK68583.1 hypothetical protein IMCC21224_113466 [Puniceibacterium sp. IMCC21224]